MNQSPNLTSALAASNLNGTQPILGSCNKLLGREVTLGNTKMMHDASNRFVGSITNTKFGSRASDRFGALIAQTMGSQ